MKERIAKLKKDLLDKLTYINVHFKTLNSNNVDEFRAEYRQFNSIKGELDLCLREYYDLIKPTK